MNAVDPSIGGVLLRGEKGTGKTTAACLFAAVLPPKEVVSGCRFGCIRGTLPCDECRSREASGEVLRYESRGGGGGGPRAERVGGPGGREPGPGGGASGGEPEVRDGGTGEGERERVVHRRSEPPGRSRGGRPSGRGGVGRERGDAGGSELPAPVAVPAGGDDEPGRRGSFGRSCWTGSGCASRSPGSGTSGCGSRSWSVFCCSRGRTRGSVRSGTARTKSCGRGWWRPGGPPGRRGSRWDPRIDRRRGRGAGRGRAPRGHHGAQGVQGAGGDQGDSVARRGVPLRRLPAGIAAPVEGRPVRGDDVRAEAPRRGAGPLRRADPSASSPGGVSFPDHP